MNNTISNINEKASAAAFTQQSKIFDDLYSGNTIIQYKRQRVRLHVQEYLLPNSSILELNSGTGEDAIWFALHGHHVHATDISEGMMEVLIQKRENRNLQENISYELCSFTELDQLKNKGPYDFIFSNFAGLNCTNELDKVLQSFSSLLKKDGIVTLVLLPKFCLWESLLLLKGKFRTATRRFFSNKGAVAHINGKHFRCWYYNPSFISKHLKNSFDVLSVEGLCSFVPPSYMETFPEKRPKAYHYLKTLENKLKNKWPWKFIGDYYIISLKRKSE